MIAFSKYLFEGLYPAGYSSQPYGGNAGSQRQGQRGSGGNIGTYVLGGLALAGAGAGGYYLYNQHRWNNLRNQVQGEIDAKMSNSGTTQEQLAYLKAASNKFFDAAQAENRWSNPKTTMVNLFNGKMPREEYNKIVTNAISSIKKTPEFQAYRDQYMASHPENIN